MSEAGRRTDPDEVESIEQFRARARAYIEEHVPPAGELSLLGDADDEQELAAVARDRELQRILYDGGLAGIVVPKEYGGQGLTEAHARVLNEEMEGRAFPFRIQVPTMTPCMAVILEFGTEDQKRTHVDAILRGEEIWMQMLSEPSGGSDVAGAQTSAVRDGDEWVLNGSKVWTTGAWWADWGLCLARTNWDVPKHQGLSVFMVPFDSSGVEIHRIELLNGSREFCQEFLTDVRIPADHLVGRVDDGWTVGRRWMFHERSFGSSPYALRPIGAWGAGAWGGLAETAERAGRLDDPGVRERIGEAHALILAASRLPDRIVRAMMTGALNEHAASMLRLMGGLTGRRLSTLRWEVVGATGAAWTDDDADLGAAATRFLIRQSSEIAGGTTEMARNVVGERVLGLPRERSEDRDVAFRDVPKGPPGRGSES